MLWVFPRLCSCCFCCRFCGTVVCGVAFVTAASCCCYCLSCCLCCFHCCLSSCCRCSWCCCCLCSCWWAAFAVVFDASLLLLGCFQVADRRNTNLCPLLTFQNVCTAFPVVCAAATCCFCSWLCAALATAFCVVVRWKTHPLTSEIKNTFFVSRKTFCTPKEDFCVGSTSFRWWRFFFF